MPRDAPAPVVALLVVTSVAAAFGGTAAAGHGAEFGNYTVNLPNEEDHYPGEQGGQASIEHFAAGTQEAYDKAGSPEGYENISFIVISSQEVDFSSCTTDNTRAFGIDRDNDDSGTNTDVPLLQYRESSAFKENKIIVDFFEGDEVAAPAEPDRGGKEEGRADGDSNAELYPDDEIVARQDSCYVMPEEPGWYQIHGKLNGTNWQGDFAKVNVPSHYFYICECSSEEEARNELGPPPSEQEQTETPDDDPGTDTPTMEPTETDTPAPGETDTPERTESPTDTPVPTATPTEESNQGGNDGTDEATGTSDGEQTDDQGTEPADANDDNETPTVGNGPGFGAALAVVALLGAALAALRRGR